jgi:hypothetical protein
VKRYWYWPFLQLQLQQSPREKGIAETYLVSTGGLAEENAAWGVILRFRNPGGRVRVRRLIGGCCLTARGLPIHTLLRTTLSPSSSSSRAELLVTSSWW